MALNWMDVVVPLGHPCYRSGGLGHCGMYEGL